MVARARASAWTAGRMAAAAMAAIGLLMALFPEFWVAVFTNDDATRAVASQYFRIVGPTYGFFGAGMALFFASLAAGRVAPMLLAGLLRLVIVGVGGVVLMTMAAPVSAIFALIAVGMVAYGAMSVLVVWRGDWTPR